jgi:hypothetical protein
VLQELIRRGHEIDPQGEYDDRPRLNAVGMDPETRTVSAASDSRTEQHALGAAPRRGG